MHDFDDDLINDAFAGFTAAAAPSVRAAGTGAVRHTIKRRRARNTAVLSVLGALLLVAPVAAYASMDRGNQGPPPVATTPSVVVSPSGEPSPSQAEAPTPVTLGTCAKPTNAAPEGAIPLAELCNATLDLPAWGDTRKNCTPSSVKFTNGGKQVADSTEVAIADVIAIDLDGDGKFENVALLTCGGQFDTMQVVAFRRYLTGGIETMGQIVTTNRPIRRIGGVRAGSDGTVVVRVGDFGEDLGANRDLIQYQDRVYRWDGGKFAQAGGPAEFPPNRNLYDLSITATPLVFGPVDRMDGVRKGSFTVTVRNAGPASTPVKVLFQLPRYATVVKTPSGCTPERNKVTACLVGTLAAGDVKKLELSYIAYPDAQDLPLEFVPTVSATTTKDPSTGGGPVDGNLRNNSAEVTLRFQ